MINEESHLYLQELITKAYQDAHKRGHSLLLLEHILYAFLTIDDKSIKNFFKEHNADYETILVEVNNFLNNYPLIPTLDNNEEKPQLNIKIEMFVGFFLTSCSCNIYNRIPMDLLNIMLTISSFLFMENTFAEKILSTNKINFDVVIDIYQKYNAEKIISDEIAPALEDFITKGLQDKINQIKSEKMGENSSASQNYLINLTEKVNNEDWIKIVGRTDEIDLLEQIILRHDKPNAILVGNPGIGKTKIVEGFAKKLIDNNSIYKVYQLDTLAFNSNVMFKGELEKRVIQLTDYLKEQGNAILYIDEMHSICVNDNQNLNIANLLKPILTDNTLKIIGSTTFEEYRKYIEKDEAFTRRFYKMVIEEPDVKETTKIINEIKPYYEDYFKIKYSNDAIEEIMNLTNKFIFDKHYPDKAIDLLDMSGAYCVHNKIKNVKPNHIQKVISKMRNIPLSNISQSEEDIYKHLEERLKEKIFGQDEAVKTLCDAVIIARSGLRETSKTAISLLLTGQSGCGKTESCKQLADIMSIPLIRFDMSEYMESHSVSKLIGSPPGYKDSGDGKAGNGLLINAIDENPHCVLLLDEIEKADSKVHNILLQVMDNGKLTSSLGKQVSFENVFLIMTSNTGSYNAHKHSIGFGNEESIYDKDLEQAFLPEFRNRIDKIINFNNLSKNIMEKVCEKFIKEMGEMLVEKNIDFKYDKSIIDYVVNKAYDKDNGAREMKHIITNEIKNVIAKKIVFGEYKKNNKILLRYNNEVMFDE